MGCQVSFRTGDVAAGDGKIHALICVASPLAGQRPESLSLHDLYEGDALSFLL